MFFIFAFICIAFANISSSFCDDSDANTYRLMNKALSVISYDLRIVPNLGSDSKFDGEVSIRIYGYATIDCFTVNSKNLKIGKIDVRSSQITFRVTEIRLIPEKEMLKVCVSPFLPYYTYITIVINYEGTINDDFKGLHKMSYSENGSKKWLLATQLEPTYARMVLPCFDEPEYRAKFALSLHVSTTQEAISVTNVDSKETINNRKIINFKATALIPPHLMAFVIHEFTTSTVSTDALVTLVSKNSKTQYSQFFISELQRWFKELQEYLGVNLALKLDLMASPDADEYSRKAGLLIYKESDVFHIDGVDVEKHKEEIAKIAIHKLTHLWFDFIVVHRWWDNTWLSESFATFFEYFISARTEPKWKMNENMIVEALQNALYEEENIQDSALSSQTSAPSEIQYRKFNTFINNKGASIIRMLLHIVSDAHFQKAVHNTIASGNRREGVMEPSDLWNQMQNEIHNEELLPRDTFVNDVMDTWTKNYGYPLIKVSKTPQGAVVIQQEEYQFPKSLTTIPSQNWIIPIACTKESSIDFANTKPTLWSSGKEKQTTDIVLKDKEWIMCNLQQTGYYRVNYTEQNWALLTEQMKTDPNKIHVINRAQLLDDSFHLAMSKKLHFRVPLQLGIYLKNENELLPWLSIVKYVNYFLRLYEQTSVNEYLKHYFGVLFQHLFQKVGFFKAAGETYSLTSGRPLILETACNYLEIPSCVEKASQIYTSNINNLTNIPADQKHAVYCSAFKTSKNQENVWDKLWSIRMRSDTISERELILKSLACTNDERLQKKYVMMGLKPDDYGLRNYEKEIVINSATRSFQGVKAALNVIEEIIPKLSNQTQDTIRTVFTLSDRISTSIQSMEQLTQLKQIIAKMESSDKKDALLLETLKRSYDQGVKTVEYKDKNADDTKKAVYLVTGYVPPPPPTISPIVTSSSIQPPRTNSPFDKSSTPRTVETTKHPKTSSAGKCVSSTTSMLTFTFGLLLRYILV